MSCTRGSLIALDYPTPEQVPDIGGQGINPAFFPIKRQGKKLLLRNPEISVESMLKVSGFFLQPVRSLGIFPEITGQPGTTTLRVINIALDFAGCDGLRRQRSIGKENGIPRVFPALVFDSGLLVAALVFHVPVTIPVAIVIDPT